MGVIDFLKTKPIPLPPPVSVRDFYLAHKEEILDLIAKTEKPELKNYKYLFTSLKGNKYYFIPKEVEVPFLRFTRGLEYSHWLQNGIAPEEFDRIRKEMKLCMAHIKAKTEKADKSLDDLALLDNELDRRRKQALPYFVIVNMCANYLIREDEIPMEISMPIHEQKCDEIEAEIAAGRNGFFLTVPQLSVLLKGQNLSSEGLTELLNNFRQEAEKDKQFLKAYTSWKLAETKSKTS